MNWYIFIIGIVLSLACLFLVIIILFRFLRIRESKIGRIIIGALLVGFISILAFLCLEVFFRSFVIQSDAVNFTLASKLWYKKYWKPVNSLGYRDIEHTASSLMGKKVIFVVGDSFVAGAGIKNYQDCFSNILQKKLGGDYAVINIARLGWATEDEYSAILSYPKKPDIIILLYNRTDIEGSARKMGVVINELINLPPTPGIIKYLFNTSYFFNYSYFRLYGFYKSRYIGQIHSDYFLNCFSNEMIWQDHKRSLLNIISYAKNQNVKLIVLVFRLKTRRTVEFSKNFISKVVDFLNLNKVTVIDLADKLIVRNPRELIVNSFDRHPSVKLHKEIGSLLAEYVYQAENKYKDNR